MSTAENAKFFPENLLFDILLKTSPDRIYFKDRKSRFVRGSHNLALWLGAGHESDLWGKTDFDFFSAEHSTQAYWDEQQIMATGQPLLNFEEKETFEDGSEHWAVTSKWPLLDANHQIIGTFGISRDITDKKKAEHSLRSRQTFMANMSHEIRTPLNAILGLSKLLQKTTLDETQRNYLQTLNTSGENLLVIINDILDVSKIEAGKLSFETIGVRLEDLIAITLAGFRQKAEEKEIELRSSVDPNLSRIHRSDPVRLSQIFNNLVSNAIRFTHQGYVSIDCKLEEKQGDEERVRFTITDTGIGMNDTSNIFNSFEQENNSITRKYGGTGLGLAICNQLVRQFNGTITVNSIHGHGTTFIVIIPLPTGTENDMATPVPENIVPPESIKGKRILVVDDVDVNCFITRKFLEHANVTVDTVDSAKAAIQKLQDSTYDLVLMDMQMPEMDGVTATRYIRNTLRLNVPILALTANVMKAEEDACREAGMNDFISKPIEEGALIQKIETLLSMAPAPPEPPAPCIESTTGFFPEYSLEPIRNLSRGDKEVHNELLCRFLYTLSNQLQEIRFHTSMGELHQIRNSVHSLKSPIAFLNVKPALAILHDLESGLYDHDRARMHSRIAQLENMLQLLLEKLRHERIS